MSLAAIPLPSYRELSVLRLPISLSLVLLLASCGKPERPPRVVLITVDTLRYDAFAAAGGEAWMPETRRFAEQGAVFENFYASAASTQPTHASLFTGLQPWQHGVVRNGTVLSDEHETVVERLKHSGFTTGAVVSSFPVHSQFGYAQGFDSYDDVFTFERKKIKDEWQGVKTTGEYFYSISDDITDKAISALEGMPDGPQFLWVHYFDPHDPYGDHEEYPAVYFRLRMMARKRSSLLEPTLGRALALYEKDIRRLDGELARLFAYLEGDETHETHVLLTSDHGESFGERGGPFGHGHHLIDEQLHVPSFVVSPRGEPGIRREVAGTVDFAATILSLAGLPPELAPGGRDLSSPDGWDTEPPYLASGMRSIFNEEVFTTQADGRNLRVDTPRFYTIRDGVIWSGDGVELFAADEELEELPPFADELHRLFAGYKAELERTRTTQLDDPATKAGLKALGYGE